MAPDPMPDEPPRDVLAAAQDYLRRGWGVVPMPSGTKKPVLPEWQNLRLNEVELATHFVDGSNVGILTGEPSGGLVDVDLDSDEAVALAGVFLPPAAMWSGRESRPRSHAWFMVSGSIPANATFKDVDKDKTVLVELRGTGRQTVVAPSLHPDGDRYMWNGPLEPAEVRASKLVTATRWLAAAALIVRHWPRERGSRHDIANALAGMLLRAEWPEKRTATFVGAVARAAGDEEAADRAKDAIATARTLARGGKATGAPTLADLLGGQVVDRAREWLGLRDLIASNASIAYAEATSTPWPAPLAPAAFHGLAGEFVRLVEPHTEADPAAVLVQFLVAFGSCVGRGPHFLVEADEHHLNTFVAIVGATSKGRKGTSWGQVRRLFFPVDKVWTQNCIVSGLSSGEGLIWAVRDEIVAVRKGKEEVVDYGVEDKRLLVVESELASALRVLGREGNTLSATVRSAWDTGDLRSLTKHSPARATGAHISILGHITRDELVRYLDTTELANGFANRFVWCCARRSKYLPDGGRLDEINLQPLREQLGAAMGHARRVRRLRRDRQASELWHSAYATLSEGKPGLLGAVISRAEAQVTRLSCLYALLDHATEVRLEHLEAVLALWEYSEASTRHIFGDTLGDPMADAILKALRSNPSGLTRNEIRNLFHGNQSASRIGRAVANLLENGLARVQQEETDGRPAERWMAVQGYAIDAINAKSSPSPDPYRVNHVNRVPDPDVSDPPEDLDPGPEEPPGDDDGVVL